MVVAASRTPGWSSAAGTLRIGAGWHAGAALFIAGHDSVWTPGAVMQGGGSHALLVSGCAAAGA